MKVMIVTNTFIINQRLMEEKEEEREYCKSTTNNIMSAVMLNLSTTCTCKAYIYVKRV